jgi:hypothetical protein
MFWSYKLQVRMLSSRHIILYALWNNLISCHKGRAVKRYNLTEISATCEVSGFNGGEDNGAVLLGSDAAGRYRRFRGTRYLHLQYTASKPRKTSLSATSFPKMLYQTLCTSVEANFINYRHKCKVSTLQQRSPNCMLQGHGRTSRP